MKFRKCNLIYNDRKPTNSCLGWGDGNVWKEGLKSGQRRGSGCEPQNVHATRLGRRRWLFPEGLSVGAVGCVPAGVPCEGLGCCSASRLPRATSWVIAGARARRADTWAPTWLSPHLWDLLAGGMWRLHQPAMASEICQSFVKHSSGVKGSDHYKNCIWLHEVFISFTLLYYTASTILVKAVLPCK